MNESRPSRPGFVKERGNRTPLGREKSMPGRGPAGRNAPRPAVPQKSARRVALDVLSEVTKNGAYASLALDKHLRLSGLHGPDRRLAAGLVYDTLENQIKLDYALNQFLEKGTPDPAVLDILRLSACQILLYDRIPDSAAVNEGVALLKQIRMEPLAGFANGVLRSLVRQKEAISWPKPEEDPVRYLSIMFSIPQWLVERLVGAYGPQTAKEICSFRPKEHGISIRPNMTRLTDEAFLELVRKKVWTVKPGLAPHVLHVQGAVDISGDRDYMAGLYSIQGESSVLAAEAMPVRNGMQILDACAAPGGKAAYLAEKMSGTGRVYAWDIHPHRVELIQSVKRRLGLENLRPVIRDASVFKEELEDQMDGVLVDAPCTGTGVMLNKPDVKYRHTPETVAELVKTQAAILSACCRYVKRGGTLVYATCSVLPEENEAQVIQFLGAHPDFQLSAMPESFPKAIREREGANGLQLMAHRDGLDGFFIARMTRRS